jgi:hypothetical protein
MSKEGLLLQTGVTLVRQVPVGGIFDVFIVVLSVWFQLLSGMMRFIAVLARMWQIYPVLFVVLLYYFWFTQDHDFKEAQRETIVKLKGLPPFSGHLGKEPMTYPRNFLEDLVDAEQQRQSKMSWWDYANAPSPCDAVIVEVRKRRHSRRFAAASGGEYLDDADVLDDYLEERREFCKTIPWWKRESFKNGW